jgi:hypothetical protein
MSKRGERCKSVAQHTYAVRGIVSCAGTNGSGKSTHRARARNEEAVSDAQYMMHDESPAVRYSASNKKVMHAEELDIDVEDRGVTGDAYEGCGLERQLKSTISL